MNQSREIALLRFFQTGSTFFSYDTFNDAKNIMRGFDLVAGLTLLYQPFLLYHGSRFIGCCPLWTTQRRRIKATWGDRQFMGITLFSTVFPQDTSDSTLIT
jgi:hypothetical protein